MKNLRINIFFLLIVLFALVGCNKKVSVSSVTKENKVSDQAAFNYLYAEGLKQKLTGNLSDALKNFEQCLLINPSSDATYYEMAEIAFSTGDLKTGKKYAKKAVELNEINIWYLSLLANVYYQEKNLDSCIIYYNKALNYFPDKENLRLELATVYSENKDYHKSIDLLNYLDGKSGVNENATVLKIKDMMLLGDFDAAEKTVLSLLEKYPDEVSYNGVLAEIYSAKGETDKALIVYNNLLKKNPENPQVQLSLIDFLQKENRYEDLTGFLNTVMINSNIAKDDKVSILLKLYDDSTLINNYSSNLELTVLLLETQYKDDSVIMILRPELYQKEGRLVEAISKFDAYIKKYPDNYFAWERLLLLYSDTKDYERLVSVGRECTTKFNMSILAKLLYASGATEMEDYKTALDQLKKATILANEDKEIMTQILSMEADVYYRMGDYQKSFAKYDALLKASPGNILVLNNYAYFLAEQNLNLKEAEKMSKKTISVEYPNPTYIDTYAWILYKRGKYKEAARLMAGIINTEKPEDAEYYEHYGFILKGLNNCNEAVIYWEKALKMDSTKENLKTEISNCQTSR